MSKEPKYMKVFLDLLPNQPKNKASRKSYANMLRQRFEEALEDSVDRSWELPPIIVQPSGEYLELLLESRELYVAGRFYSCVAMCGIVGERLIKDVLRASMLVQKDGKPQVPSVTTLDQFERVDVNSIVRFLKEVDLLSVEATKAAEKLGQLRNQYTHARGRKPKSDALEAIKLLHIVVEGTVSIFKEYDIKDGAFVRKA